MSIKINILKIAIILFFLIFIPNIVLGSAMDVIGRLDSVSLSAGYDEADVKGASALATYIGKIISYFLATLGVIFLALLIYGGFTWMKAQGDAEDVEKAKDIMYNAVIGLVIVLVSYAASYYIVSKVASTAITGGGGF